MSTTTASSYSSSPTIKRIPSSPGLTGFGSSLTSLSQQQQQGIYSSDNKDNSYANMADAKNDQLPMGGHSMGQPGLGLSQGKGEYRTVGIDDDDSVGLRNAVGKGGAGLLNVPEAAQHPALPIASYCFSSILMTVVNKFVLSGQHFTMNFLLLTIQSVVCVSCVVICKRAKIINFRDFDKDDARKWFPVSFMLVMVIYTGSKSLQYLTIPVYTIFKNLTIILIAYGEVLWFGGQVSGMTLVSFGLMVLSSIVAAWNDIAKVLLGPTAEQLLPDLVDANKGTGNSTAGYIWMFINCVVSAGYVLGMRKRIKVTNFKDWDSMYYNNLLSIPVLVVFSVIFETWSMDNLRLNFPEETRSVLLFMMAFSGAAAVFISYSTAWCVRTTSSTTYSMVGSLNKLPVAASGLLFFGDPVTFCSVSAILLGFIAGLVYTVAKQAQSNAKKANGAIELGSKPR